MRGTTFETRDEMHLININELPLGRGMAAEYRGITLINIYALSATAKRMEREQFYNNELVYLLKDAPANILVGGDFNCVFEKADTTGHYTYNAVLAGLVQGIDMQDIWRQHTVGRL